MTPRSAPGSSRMLTGRNPKLTTAADKNTYADLVLSSFTQYRTRWFENKYYRTLKASVHNKMVREMGKNVFSLTSEHKIINSARVVQVCLMTSISHIKTRALSLVRIRSLTLHFSQHDREFSIRSYLYLVSVFYRISPLPSFASSGVCLL